MAAPASELLETIQEYLQTVIAPQATALDRDPSRLRHAFLDLGAHHWLALRIPHHWGGQALESLTFLKFQEQISRYSGALAFLQTQHQSAARMLAASTNVALQQRTLPQMATGAVRIGIGFSQLRRSGSPVITAEPTPEGYRLQGEIPWITGFDCFQQFIGAATLPSGEAVFGMLPLAQQTQAQGGEISLSEPLPLTAMAATNTVKAQVNGWLLRADDVVDIKPPGWIQANDRHNILKHAFFALGCAQAGLDVITAAQTTLPGFVGEYLRSQTAELNHCRQAIYQAHPESDYPEAHRLGLRARAIALAGRCAQAAVAVSRGAANIQDHPAQRVYREALAFTVFGQTTAVMAATLSQLVSCRTGADSLSKPEL